MTAADNNTTTIKIRDKQYNIKCPVEQSEALQQAAQYFDEKMQESSNSTKLSNDNDVAVITALNICHELLTLKKQREEYIQSMGERIQSLHAKIETVLTKQEELEL